MSKMPRVQQAQPKPGLDEVSYVLLRACNLLGEYGLAGGALQKDERMCAAGAINMAATGQPLISSPLSEMAQARLAASLPTRLGDNCLPTYSCAYGKIFRWNDNLCMAEIVAAEAEGRSAEGLKKVLPVIQAKIREVALNGTR